MSEGQGKGELKHRFILRIKVWIWARIGVNVCVIHKVRFRFRVVVMLRIRATLSLFVTFAKRLRVVIRLGSGEFIVLRPGSVLQRCSFRVRVMIRTMAWVKVCLVYKVEMVMVYG